MDAREAAGVAGERRLEGEEAREGREGRERRARARLAAERLRGRERARGGVVVHRWRRWRTRVVGGSRGAVPRQPPQPRQRRVLVRRWNLGRVVGEASRSLEAESTREVELVVREPLAWSLGRTRVGGGEPLLFGVGRRVVGWSGGEVVGEGRSEASRRGSSSRSRSRPRARSLRRRARGRRRVRRAVRDVVGDAGEARGLAAVVGEVIVARRR